MKAFDRDKFIKVLIIAITLLVVVGVVVITTLIMFDVLSYKTGNYVNLCLIFVISWLNFYIQLLSNQKKLKMPVVFLLVFSVLVSIALIIGTVFICL